MCVLGRLVARRVAGRRYTIDTLSIFGFSVAEPVAVWGEDVKRKGSRSFLVLSYTLSSVSGGRKGEGAAGRRYLPRGPPDSTIVSFEERLIDVEKYLSALSMT